MDGKIFNHYHASAAYHSLAILERKHGLRNKEKTHPVWSRLARRVQEMVENDEVQPQTVANVLWSLGQLFSHRVTLPRNMICVCVFFGLGRGDESFCFQEQGLQQFCKTSENWIFSMVFVLQTNCIASKMPPSTSPEKNGHIKQILQWHVGHLLVGSDPSYLLRGKKHENSQHQSF